MFPEQLKKILQIINRFHDRVIMFDSANPDQSYVIMDLDSYAQLRPVGENSTRSNFADLASSAPMPIPAESASPPASPVTNLNAAAPTTDRFASSDKENVNLTEEDLTDKINREISMWKNGENSSFISEENKGRPGWQIPPQVKDKAREVQD